MDSSKDAHLDLPSRDDAPIGARTSDSDRGNWLSKNLTERNVAIAIFGLFLVMALLICCVPYDPGTDLADAVTNDIWVEYYSKGIFSLPYADWSYGVTQSVVVWHDGQYQVVNEKGPGHALMLVPFYLLDLGSLFGPLMVALAVLATYMLGKRLFNWRVGAIAAVLVLTDVSVVMMWYRYYWTDASTMSLLVLSIWLMIEANYWINGRSLDPRKVIPSTRKQKAIAAVLGALAGLSFRASVSTRYATALILIPILLYFAMFYLMRAWPYLRARKLTSGVRSSFRAWPLLLMFATGLLCVLVPLMAYNSEYFGAPLLSGFDQTTLQQFLQLGTTTERDTSTEWISGSSDNLSTAASNFVEILPVLIARMPFLLLLPLGIWFIRKSYPTLALLSVWVTVNFYTYLSISWVSMYASMPVQILYEPRYFIPSVPAVALLAGVAIARLAPKLASWIARRRNTHHHSPRSSTVVVVVLMTAALVLCSLAPSAGFFAAAGQGGGQGPPQGQPPGQGGPPTNGSATPDGSRLPPTTSAAEGGT